MERVYPAGRKVFEREQVNQAMREYLIRTGSNKIAICLGWVADCGHDSIIATNSGGRARYCVLLLDDGSSVHVERLDWKTFPF